MRYRRVGRFFGLLILLVGAVPAFYYGLRYGVAFVSTPELYPGDRLEKRACRMCAGTGKDQPREGPEEEPADRCPFCRGRGVVQVLVPGANRPTRLWGAVVDAARFEDLDGNLPRNLRRVPHPFLSESAREIPGGIPRARVVLRPAEGEPVVIDTDEYGRFSRRLAPGRYRLKISAPRYRDLEGEIEVEPLTEPIWFEKAVLVREPRSPEEARSMYGLALVAGLTRGEHQPYLRFAPGN